MKGSRKLMVAITGVAVLAAIGAFLAAGSGRAASTAKVAVVTDIGGLNDKGFNSLAVQGLARAEQILHVNGRIYDTTTAADRQPNLTSAVQDGNGLVIATGVLFAFGPLPTVAKAFPNTKFGGIDITASDMGGALPNVRGLHFAENQSGCLVGNIAALEVKREHKTMISAVGANKVPAIVSFIAGYKYCAKRAYKNVQVLVNYANDPTFNDQAKCKATALGQIARGSRVVFQVAGGCGLGALDAAKTKHVWGIGVDNDQSFLGPHILTSARKKVDVAVYDTIADYVKDPSGFKAGFDQTFDLKNGGVGYGKLSPRLPKAVAAAYTKSTNALAKLIIAGKVKPPTQ